MGMTSELKKVEAEIHKFVRNVEGNIQSTLVSLNNLNGAYFELEKRVNELESKLSDLIGEVK